MRALIPAVSMAIVASATTSAGVARGFNFAKHLARSRSFRPSSSSASRRYFRGGATTPFRRAAFSTCFVGPDGATEERSESTSAALSSAPPAKKSTIASSSAASDSDDEIEETARNSLSITGSLPPPLDFGGLSYLDTSSLAANRAHRVVFVLGGPGAGKGTQSERIVDTYKCVHLSAGDLLRKGAERPDYPHADLVKECLVRGNIVPVELSLGLLRIAMDEQADEDDDAAHGSRVFLVDGFPRNYDNVRGWTEHMPSYTAVLGALVYNCPIEVLERRIMTRAETSGRSDDNLESARRRFETFRTQTEPVVRALERVEDLQAEENSNGGQLRVVNIDAAGTIEDVWKATEEAMDAYVRNDVLTANSILLKAIEEGDIEKFADLCDGKSEVDPVYDGPAPSSVSNARVDIKDGIKATVSYDRNIKEGLSVRETREWIHGPKGWKCVCVSREVLG
ncbi:hypothetical protein ACHAWF_006733 [Thalassiosira exigua]